MPAVYNAYSGLQQRAPGPPVQEVKQEVRLRGSMADPDKDAMICRLHAAGADNKEIAGRCGYATVGGLYAALRRLGLNTNSRGRVASVAPWRIPRRRD